VIREELSASAMPATSPALVIVLTDASIFSRALAHSGAGVMSSAWRARDLRADASSKKWW